MNHLRRITLIVLASALAVVGTAQPASAEPLTYQVTNYDHDGTQGVYIRSSANVSDVSRDSAHCVAYGTFVHLECAAFGSAVRPQNNTAWDKVTVVSGNRTGLVGYLSEHWLNRPVKCNQHVAGEPSCNVAGPPASPVRSKAI